MSLQSLSLGPPEDFPLQATAVLPTVSSYRDHVNPQWVRLLEVLDMNERYVRCSGAELWTDRGRRILDFLSGYCVHNTGHNHPAIVQALQEELAAGGPAMLQSHVPELAGVLAEKLCARAGRHLTKAFFCSSGSEGVETAIKYSRAHTGRDGLLYAEGAFHGLTCGALSLMGDPFWREGFGPMLQGTEAVAFGDLAALESKLATRRFAAYVVEPLQSEAGIRIASREYWQYVQTLCRRYGTLLVLDEVQTGMYRTGPFLASQRYDVEPDIVVLAKALSGGLIPCAAVLTTGDIYDSVYGSLKRSIIHTSTFSENGLAMRAGLATLEVLESERLSERAESLGAYVRDQLRQALSGYEMVQEIRGHGLLNGIEFRAPKKLAQRVPFEAFRRIHPGMFGQVVVMQLFREGFLTQMCGNNFLVLKVAPPLVIGRHEVDEFVRAAKDVVDRMHSSTSFWTEALGMARRVMNI